MESHFNTFDFTIICSICHLCFDPIYTPIFRIWFRPRVLVDVSNVDISSKILGFPTEAPFYATACALGKLAHPDGEVAITRACGEEGIIQMIPTLASSSMDEMCQAAQSNQVQFLQLYVNQNRDIAKKSIAKAKGYGVKAVCITVDAPQLGRRERYEYSIHFITIHDDD